MHKLAIILLLFVPGCTETKEKTLTNPLLPKLLQVQQMQTDSLEKVKVLVLKYGNLYINDMDKKVNEDSMEYWIDVKKTIVQKIAGTKKLIDSLQKVN